MENQKEVTALNSHAAMATEIAELRRHLWTMIAAWKQVAHLVPNRERAPVMETMVNAEKFLI